MTIIYYFINIIITTLGRMLDLLSTYYITPNLELETNRLINRLGWKGSILLQIPLIVFGAFFRLIAVFFFIWSVIITSSNISGSWFVRNLPGGDKKYAELLKNSAKKAKLRYIILDETPPLVLFLAPNGFIWIWIQLEVGNILDLIVQETFVSFVLIVTGVLMLHGIMSFVRNVLYINGLRKKDNDAKEV
ncbi:MAG: hypothetical protein ACFFD2_05870 [Promethearchaeota archaeon]